MKSSSFQGIVVAVLAIVVALLLNASNTNALRGTPVVDLSESELNKLMYGDPSNKLNMRSLPGSAKHDGWCGTRHPEIHDEAEDKAALERQLRHDDLNSVVTHALHMEQNLKVPPCGNTVCDNAEVTLAYANAIRNGILEPITIYYQVTTIANDDGSDPVSPKSASDAQQTVLNREFASMNIQWRGYWTTLNATNLRNGVVLPNTNCPPNQVGQGIPDCVHEETGWDAGTYICPNTNCNPECTTRDHLVSGDCDCICLKNVDQSNCASLAGNGVCNDNCNYASYNWDGGDCCLTATSGKCKDPASQNRNWIGDFQLKQQINSLSQNYMNIYVVPMSSSQQLLGQATFPWDSIVYTAHGGAIFNAGLGAWGVYSNYGMLGITAVHEIGHNLGLLHTHYGVTDIAYNSKAATCSEQCFEHQPDEFDGPSVMTTGDMFSDTRPTPVNFQCSDPDYEQSSACYGALTCSTCEYKPWVNTPYTNFMGYGPDYCLNNFTPQQQGRMRCYIDLKYKNWINTTLPSTITLPPKVSYVNGANVVTWEPPMSTGTGNGNLVYIITRNPPFANGTTTVTTTATSYTDAGLAPNNGYKYAVKLQNGNKAAMYFSPYSVEAASSSAATLAGGGGGNQAMLAMALLMAVVVAIII